MKTIKIELSEQHLNVVLAALSEIPYKVAVGVINEIVAQANAQNQKEEKHD